MIDNSRGWRAGPQKEIEARTNISELPHGGSEVDSWYRSIRHGTGRRASPPGEGASNKEIARRLAISVHTAKFHVASILEKLDATGRTDAVAHAVRLGLLML
jgi:hypothetical protein